MNDALILPQVFGLIKLHKQASTMFFLFEISCDHDLKKHVLPVRLRERCFGKRLDSISPNRWKEKTCFR